MTGQLSYDLLNVFTLPGQAYTGNALAVFYDESEHKNLTQKQLQTVATRTQLSSPPSRTRSPI
jgi:predicted PhzF superfamily epimerase YddE/YHI9